MKSFVRLPVAVLFFVALLSLVHWMDQRDLCGVEAVYDGDTIRLEDGRKVRLIGVDAPEVDSPYSRGEPFGRESKKHLERLISGRKVFLKGGEEPFDRYGRTLAYVYAGDVLLNGRMIRDGWAGAYLKADYEYKDLFIAYEKEARAGGLGIWSSGTKAKRKGRAARD